MHEQLKAYFEASDVQFRVGQKTKDGLKGSALAYIQTHAIMDRLDAVVGSMNWRVQYLVINSPDGWGVLCTLSIRDPETGDWVEKSDVGVPGNYEVLKGAHSDSFKRAACQWGIGRYLRLIKPQWYPIDQWGQFTQPPVIPAHLLPQKVATVTNIRPSSQRATPSDRPRMPSVNVEALTQNDKDILRSLFEQVQSSPELRDQCIEYVEGNAELSESARQFGCEYIAMNF